MHPIMIRQMQQVVLFGLMQPVVVRTSEVQCAPAFQLHQLVENTIPVPTDRLPSRSSAAVQDPTIDLPADPSYGFGGIRPFLHRN